MSSKEKYSRLQVEVPTHFLEGIDEIRSIINMRTRKEFVDAALTILAWAVREKMKGKEIGSIDPEEGTYEELIMPCLMLSDFYGKNKEETQKGQPPSQMRSCEEQEVATT